MQSTKQPPQDEALDFSAKAQNSAGLMKENAESPNKKLRFDFSNSLFRQNYQHKLNEGRAPSCGLQLISILTILFVQIERVFIITKKKN